MAPAAALDPALSPIRAATLARFFRVLGDPTRLALVTLLADGERTAGELFDAVDGLQPRVSAHLACLRHCGFVDSERRGRDVVYRMRLDGLSGLMALASDVSSPEAERLATCTRIGPDWT